MTDRPEEQHEAKRHNPFYRVNHLIRHLKDRIRLNRKTFILYSVLRISVIAVAIRCLFMANYEDFALCLLSLILFLLPAFFEEKLKVDIPPALEGIIYLFIYAAEILGEVNKYYTSVPFWDTMLHTLNGFLCAAIGLSMVELLNRSKQNIQLSPLYLAIGAFCFSMTIGVIWEFFEFTMDQLFYLDMQKDTIVRTIGSVTLDPTHSQIPYVVSNITRTIIETADGQTVTVEGGYLDIGIIDTMKDLMVNFVGAVVFSVIGYFYERDRQKKSRGNTIVSSLILHTLSDEELEEQDAQIQERERAIDEERRARRHRKKEHEPDHADIEQ